MTVYDHAASERPLSSALPVAFLCAIAAALLALAVVLYHVPAGFVGKWGMYREGAQTFAPILPFVHDLTPMPVEPFVWSFRVLLASAWICWGTVVVLGFQGRLPSRQFLIGFSIAVVVSLALCSPAVLSNDVFTYSGYARLHYLNQANPYLADRSAMPATDPSQIFLLKGSPLPYGPLWLLIATRFARLGVAAGYAYEIVAHKLLAGVSLLVIAVAGARLADRRESGRGPLTFTAIAFNPLLLIEGPGSGHNDLLMMAFIVAAAVLYAANDRRWAALVLGLAAAVKLTALAMLPPLLLVEWLDPPSSARITRVVWTALLVAAPFGILSLLFGGPLLLFSDAMAQSAAAQYRLPLLLQAILIGGALIWSWSFVRRSRELSVWLTGAIPIALAAIVMSGVLWFPWHLTWALIPALIGWDERHRSLNVALTSGAVMLTMLYSVS